MVAFQRKRIIIDTDPGVDDAHAMLLAMASPELQIEAMTSVAGNASVEQTTNNALAILELLKADHVAVARGMRRPLVQDNHFSTFVHGESGLGGAVLPAPTRHPEHRHAVDFLIDRITASSGEITLVAIGPLTNLALAIRREPDLVNAVKEVIIMGGAIKEPGNVTPQAEFNIHCDPHAAHIVFHSGMPITLVPLDVTSRVAMTRQDVDRISAIPSPIARFFTESSISYLEFYKKYEGMDSCLIHDPLALAIAFAPDLVQTRDLLVDVDISGGVSMGRTFADFSPRRSPHPNMKVALEVDAKRFLDIFLGRIENLCQKNPF